MYPNKNLPFRELERMMLTIPGFTPKGHSTYIFGAEKLTAEMFDCKLCLYYTGKQKCCSKKRCPYIEERIFVGRVSSKEVITALVSKVNIPAFQQRIS